MDSENSTPASKQEIFLSTIFQTRLEEAENLSNLPSDETRPYDYKYDARKILEKLLLSLEHYPLENDEASITKGIIHYFLGVNFFETEETHFAEKHLSTSLES